MRTLTRPELTAALAARQLLLERQPPAPGRGDPPADAASGAAPAAPYITLASRLDGF